MSVKRAKKIHAMLYAITRDPHIGRTKLMKFIFFVDLIHYNQRGSTLFDSTYIRMPQGSVEAGAFSLAGESNLFFDVTYLRPRTGAYETYHFRKKMEPDMSLFSPYERTLLESVFSTLNPLSAKEISDVNHQLRLWREFTDGDEIPIEHLELNDAEIALLEEHGFFIDGFHRRFCRTMPALAAEIAGAVAPLPGERIASVEDQLDALLRAYPSSLDVFYDAYLAWDDAFRTALTSDPSRTLELTELCSDALCYIFCTISAKATTEGTLAADCERIEERFNTIQEEIIRTNPEGPPPDHVASLVDETMEVSRSLASRTPIPGRR